MPKPLAYSLPFGTMLRAWRLGYVLVEKRNCFLRVSDAGDNFFVEVVPCDLKYLVKLGVRAEHRVIPMEESGVLFNLSPAMRDIRDPKRPIQMLLNDAGELVKNDP